MQMAYVVGRTGGPRAAPRAAKMMRLHHDTSAQPWYREVVRLRSRLRAGSPGMQPIEFVKVR